MRKIDVRQELQNMLEEQFVWDKDREWVSVEKININSVDVTIVSEENENIKEIQKILKVRWKIVI